MSAQAKLTGTLFMWGMMLGSATAALAQLPASLDAGGVGVPSASLSPSLGPESNIGNMGGGGGGSAKHSTSLLRAYSSLKAVQGADAGGMGMSSKQITKSIPVKSDSTDSSSELGDKGPAPFAAPVASPKSGEADSWRNSDRLFAADPEKSGEPDSQTYGESESAMGGGGGGSMHSVTPHLTYWTSPLIRPEAASISGTVGHGSSSGMGNGGSTSLSALSRPHGMGGSLSGGSGSGSANKPAGSETPIYSFMIKHEKMTDPGAATRKAMKPDQSKSSTDNPVISALKGSHTTKK